MRRGPLFETDSCTCQTCRSPSGELDSPRPHPSAQKKRRHGIMELSLLRVQSLPNVENSCRESSEHTELLRPAGPCVKSHIKEYLIFFNQKYTHKKTS